MCQGERLLAPDPTGQKDLDDGPIAVGTTVLMQQGFGLLLALALAMPPPFATHERRQAFEDLLERDDLGLRERMGDERGQGQILDAGARIAQYEEIRALLAHPGVLSELKLHLGRKARFLIC
ncbi:hypothetical protein [Ktedonobacter racemifer]|uniref:hypothetical protein n=1 Tax=Ktedonobacter racemifer TaxID=363277 RepID=UPI00058DF75C|nr:hypothetical protein [Ktedonobacter racemifer]